MGWTSFSMRKPVREWFNEEWESGGNYEVLDSALVKRSTLYGAIKNKKTNEIFCAVFLVRWSKGYYNFSYKDMTEFAGPNECECPQRILDILTPLNDKNDPNGWARQWRKNCEDVHKKREIVKKAKDSIFKLNNPVQFTNGFTTQYFKKIGRILWGGNMNNDTFIPVCRVRMNITKYDFELV